MRLLEHQSKQLLAGFGLAFTKPTIITSSDAITCDGPMVLKAQVPFGGRGKAGAVKFANTTAEARQAAAELLRMELRGVKVASVSIEPKLTFTRELYVGIAWDTTAKLPVALLSLAGGVDVESCRKVARRTFDPWRGLWAHEGRRMAAEVGLIGKTLVGLGGALEKLASALTPLSDPLCPWPAKAISYQLAARGQTAREYGTY